MSHQPTANGTQIAIVGIAGRFPGAAGVQELWSNLMQRRESIRMFSPDELRILGVPARISSDPAYVPAKGALDEDLTLFDPGFFNMSPHEAALLDPQHRILLECAWEAFEDAARDPRDPGGPVGVFAGAGKNTYLLFNIAPREDLVASADLYNVLAGNEKDYLASRLAYALGLEGPSISVQTACSSGLVALHLACQSLLLYECDAALVGAAAVDVPQVAGYHFREGAMLSRDGHCRPFDAAASGTVFGNGAVALLLRRLKDAVADCDPIRAVIRGTATNNDGCRKSGFGVPSLAAQAEVAAEALASAAVEPASVGFIETHGTGTLLGDHIELDALRTAYGVGPTRSCLLGTLKANLGHLSAAAGLAGVVKAVLALESGCIPPAAGFSRPAPDLDLARSRFAIETTASHWPVAGPRRAAVHATAIGGSNAHAILEQAPAWPAPAAAGRDSWLFLLSARSATGLATLAGRLVRTLEAEAHWRPKRLEDVEWTLQVGRRPHAWRQAILAGSFDELRQKLDAASAGAIPARGPVPGPPVVGLIFGPTFASDLPATLSAAPALRELLDDLRSQAGVPVWQAGSAGTGRTLDPLLVQVAVARLLRRMGLSSGPIQGSGHGELAARCLCGDLTSASLAELGGQPAANSPSSWQASGGAAEPEVWLVLGKEATQPPELSPAAEVVSLAEPGGLLAALGRLWCRGASLDWRVLHGSQTQAVRVPLPAHPFERIRCWLPPPATAEGTALTDAADRRTSETLATREAAGSRQAPATSLPRAATDADMGVLAALVQEHLGVGQLEPDEDFFQYGASSMNALSLTAAIEHRFRVKVPGDAIFRYSDLASLLAFIERLRSEGPDLGGGAIDDELDLSADWSLASDIQPSGRAPRDIVNTVLLTGATGFLGAHLLAVLLAAAPQLTVCCLVRAESPELGRERIRARFLDLGLDAAAVGDDRVVVVPADLDQHCFGLSASAFTLLAHAVEAILHCASRVSFITSYRALRGTNVGGLREVLRLAGEGCEKPVHHVSSIAVFEADSLAGSRRITEDASLDGCRGFHNGYDLSKWVAERMAGVARERGLPVSVYRPSNIAGDSRSGVVLTDHILARFLKGCLQLGAAPTDVEINLVPVDALARAIAGRSLLPGAAARTYHLVNAEATPMRDLIRWLAARGHQLEPLSYDDWSAKMLVSSRDNAFRPFLPLLVQGSLFTGRSYARDHTDADLGPAGHFPLFDEEQLDRHLHYLARVGFL